MARAKAATAWRWPATLIVKVVDGDTVDALVTRDLGFGGRATFPIRLRLARINAPRLSSAAGRKAREFVSAVLVGPVDVTTLKTYKYGGPDDQVGEYMAEITLPDGSNLSDVLVTQKLAAYWDGEGPKPDDDGAARARRSA